MSEAGRSAPALDELFAVMVLIRRVEEQIMTAVREGLVSGSTHLCIGQEAIPVGACAALTPDDALVATYRGHGWALARGVDPVDLFAEVLGRDSALNGGRGGSAYLSAPAVNFFGENSIVGAGVPIALGLALARKGRGGNALGCVSIGDGAMNQGSVHEALNMAAVLRVPLVLVVENNGYAEMTPADALTAVRAVERAPAYGVPGMQVDGNDPTAVFEAVREARGTALDRSLPVVIEAVTHRLVGHYSGDAQAYRPPGELAARRADDPLLRAARALDDAERARIEQRVVERVTTAFEQARELPLPDPEGVLSHVYA